jgi:hypothetical protein
MQDATEHLRRLARRIMDAALERVPLRAAILLGSGGRGDADFYSTLTCFYVDKLPSEEHHRGKSGSGFGFAEADWSHWAAHPRPQAES